MIKNLLLLMSLTILTLSCTHKSADRKVASNKDNRPRHFVISLHGVRGDANAFGPSFNELIKKNIEELDSNYEVIPVNIAYPIAQPNFDTYETANIINKQIVVAIAKSNSKRGMDQSEQFDLSRIQNQINNELGIFPNSDKPQVQIPLKVSNYASANSLGDINTLPTILEDDKFSMIGYSMGGQVGLAWYYYNLYGDNSYSRNFASKMDTFFGLGAPFWGSVQASLFTGGVSTLERIANGTFGNKNEKPNWYLQTLLAAYKKAPGETEVQKLDFMMKAGKLSGREVLALSTLSDTSYKLRQDHLKLTEYVKLNPEIKTRFVSLAGLFNCKSGAGEVCAFVSDSRFEKYRDHLQPITEFLNILKPTKDDGEKLKRFDSVQASIVARFKSFFSASKAVFKELKKDIEQYGYEETFTGIQDFAIAESLAYLNKVIISEHFFGYKRHESDMVVIVPSANADFWYFKDDAKTHGSDIKYEDFKRIGNTLKQSKLVLKETIHATVDGGQFVNDMVIVNDNCKDAATCKNPVYPYFVDYLAHCDRPGNSCDRSAVNNFYTSWNVTPEKTQAALYKDIFSFAIELNLRLPSNYKLPAKFDPLSVAKFPYKETDFNIIGNDEAADIEDGQINAESVKDTSHLGGRNAAGIPYRIQLARKGELGSSYYRLFEKEGEKHLRMIFTGRYRPKITDSAVHMKCSEQPDKLKSKCFALAKQRDAAYENNTLKSTENGTSLEFVINVLGKSRKVQAKIQRGYSTYIDLNMHQ